MRWALLAATLAIGCGEVTLAMVDDGGGAGASGAAGASGSAGAVGGAGSTGAGGTTGVAGADQSAGGRGGTGTGNVSGKAGTTGSGGMGGGSARGGTTGTANTTGGTGIAGSSGGAPAYSNCGFSPSRSPCYGATPATILGRDGFHCFMCEQAAGGLGAECWFPDYRGTGSQLPADRGLCVFACGSCD